MEQHKHLPFVLARKNRKSKAALPQLVCNRNPNNFAGGFKNKMS